MTTTTIATTSVPVTTSSTPTPVSILALAPITPALALARRSLARGSASQDLLGVPINMPEEQRTTLEVAILNFTQ